MRITVTHPDGSTEGFIADDISVAGAFLIISGEDYTTYFGATSIIRADVEPTHE